MEEIRRTPGVHQHNTFANLIEEIYGDDFKFNKNWLRKNEFKFERISSSEFIEIIFDKKGKLGKYLTDYIKRVIISEDYEEMERLFEIYKSLFILKNKNNKNCIERECQEVFYLRYHPFERSTDKYNDNHKKYNYLCQHKKYIIAKIVKVLKYVNIGK